MIGVRLDSRNLYLEPGHTKVFNERRIGLKARAKSWQSGPRAQASKMDYFHMGFTWKVIGWRSLAKSWKSGFRAQASKNNRLSKEMNRRMMSLRTVARLWKSHS